MRSDVPRGATPRRRCARPTSTASTIVEVGEDQRRARACSSSASAPPKHRHGATSGSAAAAASATSVVTDLRVVSAETIPTLDDRLEIDRRPARRLLDLHACAWSKLDEDGIPDRRSRCDGFDPRYASVDFTFKAGCPSDLDCKTAPVCPPAQRPAPEINYLAKDYASFRQLILDRLALIMPDWRERHVPDIGIMLVELLAYVGDHLSYYQDAVATEAYLDTARQRISVRRHARLVDYLHARGLQRARLGHDRERHADLSPLDPRTIFFCTAFPGAPETRVHASWTDVAKVPRRELRRLRTAGRRPRPDHRLVRRRTARSGSTRWGDCECCLPQGRDRATLVDRQLGERLDGKAQAVIR